MMENRERMEDGNSQLPRTRTSRVPRARIRTCYCKKGFCHAVSSLVEAMSWIAVAGKDGHFMATILQSYSSIDDEPFGTSYSQIGMEE